MSSCRFVAAQARVRPYLIHAVLLLVLACSGTGAKEFEASTAPDGRTLLKLYPKFFFTSAYFSDEGNAHNLSDVTGLLYAELPVQVQYGVTGSLSLGAIFPVVWTYQESELRADPWQRLAIREFWLTLQHRWLTFPFVSSSSIKVKIPLADKRDWEDGLRMGDGQLDILPAYHFDYFNDSMYWFVQSTVGYKYRFKHDDVKPQDEFNFVALGGYELFPDLRMRFFLFADLTWFMNGDLPEGERNFFENEGELHNFGYGLSLWPRPSFRLEITTAGDWSGRNQYRGLRWTIGATKIL